MSKSDTERDDDIRDLAAASRSLIEAVEALRALWTSPGLDAALGEAKEALDRVESRQR